MLKIKCLYLYCKKNTNKKSYIGYEENYNCY